MKIEFVDYYEIKNDEKKGACGTAHVFLPDYNMDIRGIGVRYVKEKIYVIFPYKFAIDEDGERIMYPIINFIDDETNKDFKKTVKLLLSDHIKKLYAEKKPKKFTEFLKNKRLRP
jgi:hypothetical protein